MSFDLAPGLLVANRYRLDRLVGEGGMGAVWAATHPITRKTRALKFLKAPEGHRVELTKRFLREARAACVVEHPNIVQIHDVLELDDGTPVMVMELLAGESFQQKLEREGRVELSELAGLMISVVSAVGAAHAAGVVHRDLEPDNIFLARGAGGALTVEVLDFGIAKVSFAGEIAGARSLARSPAPARCSGRRSACRPSRLAAGRTSTTGRTFAPSASSFTSASRGSCRRTADTAVQARRSQLIPDLLT